MKIIYIDHQNLKTVFEAKTGLSLNMQKLYVYLTNKFKADLIKVHVGYIAAKEPVYAQRRSYGYDVKFKETTSYHGELKANVDADLIIDAMVDYYEHDLSSGILVSNDGDFSVLVQFWINRKVYGGLVSPNLENLSTILKRIAVTKKIQPIDLALAKKKITGETKK